MGDALAASLAVVQQYTTAWFGSTSTYDLLVEWLPLALCAVLPVLCVPFVACGHCIGNKVDDTKMKFGERTAFRKILVGVRAGIRMDLSTKLHRRLSAFTSSDVEVRTME